MDLPAGRRKALVTGGRRGIDNAPPRWSPEGHGGSLSRPAARPDLLIPNVARFVVEDWCLWARALIAAQFTTEGRSRA